AYEGEGEGEAVEGDEAVEEDAVADGDGGREDPLASALVMDELRDRRLHRDVMMRREPLRVVVLAEALREMREDAERRVGRAREWRVHVGGLGGSELCVLRRAAKRYPERVDPGDQGAHLLRGAFVGLPVLAVEGEDAAGEVARVVRDAPREHPAL